MSLVTAVVLTSLLAADEGPAEFSRFYFHEALAVGTHIGSSIHNEGVLNQPGATGHNDIQALAINFISTVGFRFQQSAAIGGQIQLSYMPWLNASELRRVGFKQRYPSFGLSGVMGPSLILFPQKLRFDLTAGFFFVFTGPEPGKTRLGFGGTGPGLTVAGGYDLLLGCGPKVPDGHTDGGTLPDGGTSKPYSWNGEPGQLR